MLTEKQHAFRTLQSTITSLLMNGLITLILKRPYNFVFYLEKVFDTVNHEILLEKHFRYGLQGKVINWFNSTPLDENGSAKPMLNVLSLGGNLWHFPGFLPRPPSLHHFLPGESKKRPAFERQLLPEYINNDILQYLIE